MAAIKRWRVAGSGRHSESRSTASVLGRGGRVGVGFEAVDIGGELGALALEVEVAAGVEGEHGVVLDHDARWRGESLDVEDREPNALAREIRHGGIGLAPPDAIEAIRAKGMKVILGVEVERVWTIGVHRDVSQPNSIEQHDRRDDDVNEESTRRSMIAGEQAMPA